MKRLTGSMALIILISLPVLNAMPSSPYDGLDSALTIYSRGYYDEAANYFSELAGFYPIDNHNSIFRFMAAKSLFKAGAYARAKGAFHGFIETYPSSTYLDACYLYLAHIEYFNGNLFESSILYLQANDIGLKTKAGIIAADNLYGLIGNDLSIEELAVLAEDYPQANLAGEVMYYLGKRYYDNGHYARAAKVFDKYLLNYRSGSRKKTVRELLAQSRQFASQKLLVGVLAPLTGSFSQYGKNLVEGVKLAFEQMQIIDGKQIELRIIDTQGSPVVATKAVKELIREEPAAVIGPLRSESAVGVATLCAANGIPMISPTASEKGINELGDGIYQLSPSAEQISTALAEYAMNDLGLKEFGIIAPGDFTGRQVSRAFTQKVYQLGGQVLASTYYERGSTDFSNQITPLRDILLMKTEEQFADLMNWQEPEVYQQTYDDTSMYFDSTWRYQDTPDYFDTIGYDNKFVLSDSMDFGPDLTLEDSLKLAKYYDFDKEKWYDKEDWRVYLDGLFLPGYSSELALLVPQIRYHVITTQYLGLDGWNSSDLIEKIERYINGTIFATDYYPEAASAAWDKFYLDYYASYSHEPDRIASLSYDAASLIRSAFENGSTSGKDVNNYLRMVADFEGTSGMINFSTTAGANDAIDIYQIKDLMISRVDHER